MKKWLDYCYYRAASFYREWGDDTYVYAGAIISYGSVGFNIMTVCQIIQTVLFNIPLTKNEVIFMAILSPTVCLFVSDDEKLIILEKKYKNENHKKLKGWLVFAYWLCSMIIFGISIAIFK